MHKLWVKMALLAQDSGDSLAQYLPAMAVGREAEERATLWDIFLNIPTVSRFPEYNQFVYLITCSRSVSLCFHE